LLSTTLGTAGLGCTVVFMIIIAIISRRQSAAMNWNAGIADAKRRRQQISKLFGEIRAIDPNFSVAVFDDFVYALYAHAHTLRAGGNVGRLSAYLRPEAQNALMGLGQVAEVRSIVIGAMRYLSVDGLEPDEPAIRMEIELETNYAEIPAGPPGAPPGREQGYYACERWVLVRNKGVLSRTPDRARVFVCPSCGAPLDTMLAGTCNYCHANVDTGQFDWVVESIEIAGREQRGPMLTGDTAEKGTDLPTIYDSDLEANQRAMLARDPGFSWPALQSRVALIFASMQASWGGRDASLIRPFVSDSHFQSLSYWIDAYKRAGLRNITENAVVENIQAVRVVTDRFFDAITVRVFASSTDFTVADATAQVVSGSRTKRRTYTEYWTLLRAVGAKGPARTDGACPNCGAPLKVEAAGNCAYCRAKVTSGEFDWVLSRIEQDDVYEG
jgi:hypothetical protein